MNPRLFVLVAVLLGGMGQGVVAPRLPELLHGADELALASGFSATLLYLAIFVSTFHYGRAADRGRTHKLLGGGLIAYAATLIGLALCRATAAVYALRFCEGLSISAVYVAADFVLGRLSASHERGRWLSYYGVALSIGLLLGPLLALALGLKALFVVAAAALTLSAPGFTVRVEVAPGDSHEKTRLNFAPLFTGAAYGYMEAALVAVFPVLAVTEFGVKPETCLIAVILAAAASSLAWGLISDRKGPRVVIIALLTGLGFGAPLLGWFGRDLSGPTLAFAASIFFGTLAGGLYPVGFAWLLEGLPESRYGYASGGFARAYGLGSLFGPLVAGLAAQSFQASGLFGALAFAGLAGLGVVLFQRRP